MEHCLTKSKATYTALYVHSNYKALIEQLPFHYTSIKHTGCGDVSFWFGRGNIGEFVFKGKVFDVSKEQATHPLFLRNFDRVKSGKLFLQ